MEATKFTQDSTGLIWMSCFAIISILFQAFSLEDTRSNPNERKNEIYWSNLHSSYGLDNSAYSFENQRSEISPVKFLTLSRVLFPKNNQSELSLMTDGSIAADCSSINFLHTCTRKHESSTDDDSTCRRKRQNGNADDNAPGSPEGDSTNVADGHAPSSAGNHSHNTTGDHTPTPTGNGTTNPTGDGTPPPNVTITTAEPEEGGWPTWVWIVIAVAVILVLIAIIIGIIVCINMNKNPEEVPPSGAESAESLSGSESEGPEEEGGRRLHRGRRQIAACSYCPQTLQRYENDGVPCGRNCCDTELYERQNLSNTS